MDLTQVTFESLKKSKLYDDKLLEALEQENFFYLENSEVQEKCEDRSFVEPLLYACINSRKVEMFQIYTHLNKKVQTELLADYNLSCNILTNAPEVIKETPLAKDENAILNNINGKPEIAQYISENLIKNPEFMNELIATEPNVIRKIIEKYSIESLITTNPDLVNNPAFVAQAVANDRTAIVGYILENKDTLELAQIDMVRDAVKDNAEKDYMKVIDENAEKSSDERFKKVQSKVVERGDNNPLKMRWITAMAAQAETIDPEMVGEVVDYLAMTTVKFEKVMQENPDREISVEEVFELITPQILSRLMDKAQIKEMVPDIEQKVEEYNKFYEEFHGKFVQQKQAKLAQKKEQAQDHVGEVHALSIKFKDKGVAEAKIVGSSEFPLPPTVREQIQEHGLPSKERGEVQIEQDTKETPARSISELHTKGPTEEYVK